MKTHSTLFCVVAALVVSAMPRSSFGISYSIDQLSPEFTVGVQFVAPAGAILPGQIFTPIAAYAPTPPPVPPPGVIVNQLPGEVDALSYGRSPQSFHANNPVFFSLDRGSAGLLGTGSANEFNFGGPASEQSSDVFHSVFNNFNTLFADGDGVAQFGNPNGPAFPLGTGEAATFPFPPQPPFPPALQADLDALDFRFNTQSQGGSPTGRLFASFDAGTAFGLGGMADDIFVEPTALGTPTPILYAPGGTLGIGPGPNDIDALVVYDNGDNQYQPGTDIVLFSLAPGSTYLGQFDPITGVQFSEGDILIDGASAQALLGSISPNAAILHTAESLGLRTTRAGFAGNDNLNALDVPEPGTCMALMVVSAIALGRRRASI